MTAKDSDVSSFILPAEGGSTIATLSPQEYYRQVSKPQRRLQWKAWPLIARRLFVETFFNGLMDRGATLSFFTLLTTVPTLTAFYSIVTLVLSHNKEQVTDITNDFISTNVPDNFEGNAHRAISLIIGSTQQSLIALVVSVLFALFSSSAYVRAFSRNANGLYGRAEGRSIVRTWLTMWGLTIALVIGLVMIAIAFFFSQDILQPLLGRFSEPLHIESASAFILDTFLPVWVYVRWPVIFGASIILIALLYHFAPNVRYGRVRWLTSGSVFALVSITAVGLLVRVYWQNFYNVGSYGALGGLIAGFIGLVIANTLLLLGLKLDAEITRARELQAGLDSSVMIVAPPRSEAALQDLVKLEESLKESAETFQKEL
ncbi:YihY/virulence factor BrkB family protein [Corynebacterium sp. zg254]|uniref:YihY/virulence factor BrkB family protein n=1 Tax=Corynebacterium zhongnanshanii TaxID=2768834 RepID=A0ABQ6VDZ4_9CORY|nr:MULTISPECIES: YihY/virulence factor BrkB family protein [Corynebacterium]KAB3522662.1 YihY/virulence factor BrkB family protein [Corynebacterium zhongnanshanii]MCR5914290.1 YihY/virulence factor BrkB family protein [Corynebacterium sp. zg254]